MQIDGNNIFSIVNENMEYSIINDAFVPNPTIINLTNFPNPFNPSTTIMYTLSNVENVVVNVYNVRGQMIRMLVNEKQDLGLHSVIWDGKDMNGNDVGSGIYFTRIKSDTESQTKKMLLIK
jgi:hypothetical protein